MPNSVQYPGQAVVEFELVVPNNLAASLSRGVFNHVSTTTLETIHGVCRYKHRVSTASVDFADKLLKEAMASGTPRLRFRLGVGVPDSMFWLPWQEHIIVGWTGVLESIGEQAGHTLDIVTQDYLYLLGRGTRVHAHKGTVSQIIKSLADANGFEAQVIEETQGDGIYIQTLGDNDVAFVRNRLIARSLNKKGLGNYALFFRDNSLHFHSPDYQAEVHNIIYFQTNAAALTMRDSSQSLLQEGNAGAVVVSYNPYTGETKTVLNSPDKTLKFANSIYSLSDLPFIRRPIRYHTSANRPEEADAICQNAYDKARSQTFALKLEVDKLIQVRHGDIVNLIVAPSDQKSSPWSGYYVASAVQHDVKRGAIRSVYTLTRGEIGSSLSNTVTVNSQEVLVSELEAPGQPLNISEIKSSQRTKGDGKISTNGRLFSSVLDPNVS